MIMKFYESNYEVAKKIATEARKKNENALSCAGAKGNKWIENKNILQKPT